MSRPQLPAFCHVLPKATQCALVLLVTALCSPSIASGALAGELDQSFGSGGVVITDFGGDDYAHDVALQEDGKIVVAGQFSDITDGSVNFALARYHPNGRLDRTFGREGRVVLPLVGEPIRYGYANTVAIQPDGRIVAAGYVTLQVSGFAVDGSAAEDQRTGFAVARFLPNGTPDRSFGRDGLVVSDRDRFTSIEGVALQRDGKIVVAGAASDPATGWSDFAVARLLSNGRFDRSFGGDGVVTTDLGSAGDLIRAIAIQADGKIVAAGAGGFEVGQGDVVVARYLVNGTLDPTFGSNGVSITAVAEGYSGGSVSLQRDGRVVVGLYAPRADANFAVLRYLSDGTLDPEYGTEGLAVADLGQTEILYDVIVDRDQRCVAVGAFTDLSTGIRSFLVTRFDESGALDLTFSAAGYTLVPMGSGSGAVAFAVTLQQNGKIVASGFANGDDGAANFALARFHGRGE